MGNDNQKPTYTNDFIGPIFYHDVKSYIISKENYEHFLEKNPNQQLQVKGKINVTGEYYVISEIAYNEYNGYLQEDQKIILTDLRPMRRQVLGPIDYDNRDYYVINKENYEYVLRKIPNQQVIEEPAAGPINVNEEYYVISKRAYNNENILQNGQQNLRLQRFLQQLVQPTNYCGKECYIIDIDNYENFLGNIPILASGLMDNEDYYLISEKVYLEYLDFLSQMDQQNLKQITQRLVRQEKYKNSECYMVSIQNYDLFLNETPFMEKVKSNKVNYVISKVVYDEYINYQLLAQQFMRRLIQPINYHNREYYVIDKEYYSPNQQIIEQQEQHVVGPINVNEEYYIINKEAYFLQTDQQKSLIPEQQNQLLIQQFMLRFVQPINYHNTEYYVIDKEYYLLNQQIIEQHVIVGPINVNEEYYAISKEAYDHFSGNLHNVPKNKRNRNVKELEQNYQKLGHKINRLKQFVKNNNEFINKSNKSMTFHLGNQDSNSTGQLSEDIRNLHHKLETFCRVKKGVEIKPKAKELLEKYNCSITGKLNKHSISGALERKVIETIIEKTNEYLNREEDDEDNKIDDEQQQNLEAKIVKATEQLMKLTDLFSTIRTETDEVSKAVSTKLRQQIYGILGNSGFSNIFTDKEHPEHPLIVKLRKDILDLMNHYRIIKNHERLVENEKLINKIIREVINIFFFRLKAQEPIAEWKWLPNNTKINTLTMEAWDENEENLYFDLCTFPLIGCNLSSTDGDEKVIFPAQVIMNNS